MHSPCTWSDSIDANALISVLIPKILGISSLLPNKNSQEEASFPVNPE
jgi:hypothetical protein